MSYITFCTSFCFKAKTSHREIKNGFQSLQVTTTTWSCLHNSSITCMMEHPPISSVFFSFSPVTTGIWDKSWNPAYSLWEHLTTPGSQGRKSSGLTSPLRCSTATSAIPRLCWMTGWWHLLAFPINV